MKSTAKPGRIVTLSKRTSIVYISNHLLDRNSKYIIYCSLFLSYFNNLCIWGNTYPTNINGILLLQKRVIRIMCGAGRLDHTN